MSKFSKYTYIFNEYHIEAKKNFHNLTKCTFIHIINDSNSEIATLLTLIKKRNNVGILKQIEILFHY